MKIKLISAVVLLLVGAMIVIALTKQHHSQSPGSGLPVFIPTNSIVLPSMSECRQRVFDSIPPVRLNGLKGDAVTQALWQDSTARHRAMTTCMEGR